MEHEESDVRPQLLVEIVLDLERTPARRRLGRVERRFG
jgi:hypothetical protein